MDDRKTDMAEVIAAGEKGLATLRKAYAILSEADDWSFIDMAGGGLISDLVKRSKIKKSNQLLEKAREELAIFGRELRDVNERYVLNIEIDGDVIFYDLFLDNIYTDWKVRKEIVKSYENVGRAVSEIETLIRNLRESLEDR